MNEGIFGLLGDLLSNILGGSFGQQQQQQPTDIAGALGPTTGSEYGDYRINMAPGEFENINALFNPEYNFVNQSRAQMYDDPQKASKVLAGIPTELPESTLGMSPADLKNLSNIYGRR